MNNILIYGPKIRENLPKYDKCSITLGQFKSNIVYFTISIKA